MGRARRAAAMTVADAAGARVAPRGEPSVAVRLHHREACEPEVAFAGCVRRTLVHANADGEPRWRIRDGRAVWRSLGQALPLKLTSGHERRSRISQVDSTSRRPAPR